MSDLIYLNRFSALGGGQKNDLGLYETVIQALAAQAIAVADPNKVRAIMQTDPTAQGQLKEKDADGTMRDLDARFDKSVRGIAYVDPQWKITPINWNENDVNRDLMKLVIDIVYNYFGITADIVNNKATEIEYQLFVKNHVEPIARQVEQEFTGKIFSRMEQAHGNRLELDTFWLQVSTLATKTAFFNVVSRNGVMNNDDARNDRICPAARWAGAKVQGNSRYGQHRKCGRLSERKKRRGGRRRSDGETGGRRHAGDGRRKQCSNLT